MNTRHATVQPDIKRPSRARRKWEAFIAACEPHLNRVVDRCVNLRPLSPLGSALAIAFAPVPYVIAVAANYTP